MLDSFFGSGKDVGGEKRSAPANRRRFLRGLIAMPTAAAAGMTRAQTNSSDGQSADDTRFGEVTGYRLERHIGAARLAILPLGAVEYHGPSGFASADSALAEGISLKLAARLRASVFPTVHYTHCPAHTVDFTGTVSVRPDVMTMYFADVLRGVVANKFNKVLILNGHSGNIPTARGAISQVTYERPESQMLMVNWWETLPVSLLQSLKLFTSGNGGRGHGGPLEISAAAVFAPRSVEAGRGPDLPASERATEEFSYYLEKKKADGWPGYSGKLSEISREKGEKLIEIAEGRIASLVENWLRNESKPGNW